MRRLTPSQQEALLARVRKICLAFPDTSERASHGESAFFVRHRSFANTDAYHHGAEHYSLWVAAPLGAQDCSCAVTRATTSGRRTSAAAAGWASRWTTIRIGTR